MMLKKGISPLIATVLLISLVVVLSFGVYTWITTVIKPLQESADISQFVEINIDAKFTEDSDCQSSDLEYCYGLIITNNENFKIAYSITTITPQGMETENYLEYVLNSYESKIFEIY